MLGESGLRLVQAFDATRVARFLERVEVNRDIERPALPVVPIYDGVEVGRDVPRNVVIEWPSDGHAGCAQIARHLVADPSTLIDLIEVGLGAAYKFPVGARDGDGPGHGCSSHLPESLPMMAATISAMHSTTKA